MRDSHALRHRADRGRDGDRPGGLGLSLGQVAAGFLVQATHLTPLLFGGVLALGAALTVQREVIEPPV